MSKIDLDLASRIIITLVAFSAIATAFMIYSGVSPEEAREAMQADERNP